MRWTIAVAISVATAPSSAQVVQGPAESPIVAGPWSPPETGVSFPERIGDLRRTSIRRYGSENWSVGYDLIRDEKKVSTTTVFLYAPADRACAGELDGAVEAITASYPGAVEISRAAAESPQGRRPGTARKARHRMTATFDGVGREVLSDTYVYCHPGSRWTIKYRATWPVLEVDGERASTDLLRAIEWPATLAD